MMFFLLFPNEHEIVVYDNDDGNCCCPERAMMQSHEDADTVGNKLAYSHNDGSIHE